MERMLVMGAVKSGAEYILAGDRHYEGLQAPDGTDIGSRTKHREYMRRNGLTMADDFKGEWSKAAAERELRREGKHEDKGLRETLQREMYRRST